MKCKYCAHVAPSIVELRQHWQGRHSKEWKEITRALELYDHDHAAELSSTCKICKHRKAPHV